MKLVTSKTTGRSIRDTKNRLIHSRDGSTFTTPVKATSEPYEKAPLSGHSGELETKRLSF